MHDFTPDVINAVRQYADEGLPANVIADLIRIPRGTFKEWMEKGDDGIEPFCRVSTVVRHARGEWARARWQDVTDGGKGSAGSQWQLTKMYPEELGDRQTVDVNVTGAVLVATVNLADASLEQLAMMAGNRRIAAPVIDVVATEPERALIGRDDDERR